MKRFLQILVWTGVAALGAVALATIAFHRGEPINATWFVLAAACSYLVSEAASYVTGQTISVNGGRYLF